MLRPDWATLDLRYCAWMNRASDVDFVRWVFAVVSRLGDGAFWYALMVALPLLYGPAALTASVHMALAGLAALFVYRAIKARTSRQRPYRVDPQILAHARPLDHYSFPSGHTLQAVSFTTVACHYHPELAWVLVSFTVLVGISRPVLGLHYPSDVVVGGLLGWVIARAVIEL